MLLEGLHNVRKKKVDWDEKSVLTSREIWHDSETDAITKVNEKHLVVDKNEPQFVKVYFRFLTDADELDDVPVKFLRALLAKVGFNNNGGSLDIRLDAKGRDDLVKRCGVSDSQVRRYIAKAVEAGLILPTGHRGDYEVNPHYVSRGHWKTIKELRSHYTIKDDKWIRK